MQQDEFCNSDVFLKAVHPADSKGGVVLEGPVKKRINKSVVSAKQLARLVKHVCIQKDIVFTPSRFYGNTLLLNFAGTNALFSSIAIDRRFFDIQLINSCLAAANIPGATLVLNTGVQYHLIWILDEEIPQSEFYKIYFFQSKLFYILKESGFSPDPSSLEIVSKVPVPGSINSVTNQHVSLVPTFSSLMTKKALDSVVFSGVDAIEQRRITSHARVLQELLALFDSRVLMISSRPDLFDDWIFFIGCSLRLFCSEKQLEKELSAVVIALEGLNWEKCKEKYVGLIKGIASGTDDLKIKYKNQHFNLSTWANFIYGRLSVTEEEIDRLGLYYLAGEEGATIVDVKQVVTHKYGFVTDDDGFIPVSELFMRNVS